MWPLVVVDDFIFSMSTGLQNAKLAKKNFIQQNVGPYWYETGTKLNRRRCKLVKKKYNQRRYILTALYLIMFLDNIISS